MSRIVARPADSALPDTSIDIEAIVRRVLMQLRPETASGDASAQSEPAVPTSLSFDAGVCSLEDINTIDASIKHLQLSSRTVVTPAARDELRRRGIVTEKSAATSHSGRHRSKPQPGTRAINLQCDGEVAEHLFAAVKKQVRTRGVRLCDRASVEVILSSRPATTAHQRTGPDRCVVAINRVDDVSRFIAELSPNTFVLDIAHLHLVAIATTIASIAKPTSQAFTSIPRITVAGGLS